MLARHGHSFASSLALVATMQKLVDIREGIKKTCKMLQDEARANCNITLAGIIAEDIDDE